tara:strand:+ start:168 stop:965 length:798 start_codon:yes stop_codon:yes gene_type:complete
MSSVSGGATVIVDKDGGDAVTVTSSRLDVNAYLNATPTIDIGDVSLLLGGTAASVNNGSADATTLRVTIADDSTGVLSIDDNGGSLTIDGTVTANLSATDNAVLDAMALNLVGINGSTYLEDSAHSSGNRGIHILSVRDDGEGSSSGTDGDYQSLITDSEGCLWIRPSAKYGIDTFAMLDIDNTDERLSDTVGVNNTCDEIFLQADEANSGYVIVGDVDVADNRGMKLNPGDTLILNIVDTRSVYLWGSADNQNVRCMIKARTIS